MRRKVVGRMVAEELGCRDYARMRMSPTGIHIMKSLCKSWNNQRTKQNKRASQLYRILRFSVSVKEQPVVKHPGRKRAWGTASKAGKAVLHQLWVLLQGFGDLGSKCLFECKQSVHSDLGSRCWLVDKAVFSELGSKCSLVDRQPRLFAAFLSSPSESLCLSSLMGAPGRSHLELPDFVVAICPSQAFKILSASVYLLTLTINMN